MRLECTIINVVPKESYRDGHDVKLRFAFIFLFVNFLFLGRWVLFWVFLGGGAGCMYFLFIYVFLIYFLHVLLFLFVFVLLFQ